MMRRMYRQRATDAMTHLRDPGMARTPCGTGGAERGFTLIEIMVVVVILGILAALVAPNVIRRVDDARVTKAKQDIRAYETALNLYRMDNFRYPATEQGLEALVKQPTDPNIRNWKQGGYCRRAQEGSLGQRLSLHRPRHPRRVRPVHARRGRQAGRRRP